MTDTLSDTIQNNLDKIDFGGLDTIAAGLDGGDLGLFGGESFGGKIGKILSGEYAADFPNMFGALFSLIAGVFADILPFIIIIVAISILSGFIQSLRPDSDSGGVRDIVHFAAFAAVVTIVLYAVADLTAMSGRTLGTLKAQMDVLFPLLLTLMAAVGGAASVSVYQPAIVMLSSGVMQIFTYVVMPIFVITLVFSIVGNLSPSAKYDKFVAFFTSAYKWLLGLTFTVFLGFLSIQGITAGAHDGISVRAAKFTMSSYIPFLGGYLSQGFDLIMASSILIKNAIGVAGLYLLLGVMLTPILKIAVFILGLKLAAAVTQPLADARISNFLSGVTKAFTMLLAVLIGAAFMYFLTIGLVIVTGNVL